MQVDLIFIFIYHDAGMINDKTERRFTNEAPFMLSLLILQLWRGDTTNFSIS